MKIKWNKMHVDNYDGTCEQCGGTCTDPESIEAWSTATAELNKVSWDDSAAGKQRRAYLTRMIKKHQNWKMTE